MVNAVALNWLASRVRVLEKRLLQLEQQEVNKIDAKYGNNLEHGAMDFPEHGATDFPEHGATDFPQNGATDFLEHGTTDFPQNGATDFPQHDAADFSEQCAADFSEHGARDFPEHGATDFPDYRAEKVSRGRADAHRVHFLCNLGWKNVRAASTRHRAVHDGIVGPPDPEDYFEDEYD